MTNVNMSALIDRLAARRPTPPGDLMRQDAPVALISLLSGALDDGDLTAEEAESALRLAEAGELLRSSKYLAQRLIAYRAEHFAAA